MTRTRDRSRRARVRRSAGAAAAVLTASAVLAGTGVGGVSAYFSDQELSMAAAQAGETGVRVDTTVTAEGSPFQAELIDDLVAAIRAKNPLLSDVTVRPAVTTYVNGLIGSMQTYTLTLEVENTGTLTEDASVQLFDFFDNLGHVDATGANEKGVVLVSSGGPASAALASLTSGSILGVSLADVIGTVPGVIVDGRTADGTMIPGSSSNGTFAGQQVQLPAVTLAPGESRTYTYTVLVRTDGLPANLNLQSPSDINLMMGASARAVGVNLGAQTAWYSVHQDYDGTSVHVDVNHPPVITTTSTQDLTPFIGQIGDAGQPSVDAYTKGLFKATDVEDANAALTDGMVVTGFDPKAAGIQTVTANVTDSGGLAADPVSQNVNVWNFVDVASGSYHALAIDSRGRAWGWGSGSYGKVDGSGGSSNAARPQLIKGLPAGLTVKQAAGGWDTSYFLMSDGSVWSLGYGGSGELGMGTAGSSTVPVKVAMPAGVQVVKIGAMRYSVAALTSTGAVYTWGYNDYGALGTGDTTNRPTPVQIISSGAVDVDQGAYGGAAVMSDGTIWQWGNNANGEMGTGTAGGSAKVPTPVVGVANAKRVDVGQYHTLYVTNDGNAWGYGANTWNAFLPGGTGAVKPTLISGAWNGQVRQAHAGWDYTQILTTAGDLYAIGYNSYDSLFIGNATNQTAYVKSNVISGLQKVEGFYDNDVALSLDGARISTKGYAGAGGLGNGSSTGDLYGATVGSISLTNVYADGNAYDPTVIGTLPLARRTAMSLPVPVQEPVVVAQQPEAGPEEVEVPAEEAATEAETSAPEEPATGAEEPVEESLEDGAGADIEPAEEHAPSAPGPVTAEQELQAAEVVPES